MRLNLCFHILTAGREYHVWENTKRPIRASTSILRIVSRIPGSGGFLWCAWQLGEIPSASVTLPCLIVGLVREAATQMFPSHTDTSIHTDKEHFVHANNQPIPSFSRLILFLGYTLAPQLSSSEHTISCWADVPLRVNIRPPTLVCVFYFCSCKGKSNFRPQYPTIAGVTGPTFRLSRVF